MEAGEGARVSGDSLFIPEVVLKLLFDTLVTEKLLITVPKFSIRATLVEYRCATSHIRSSVLGQHSKTFQQIGKIEVATMSGASCCIGLCVPKILIISQSYIM